MNHELTRALLRDIDSLNRELALYPDDNSVWREVPGIPNVGGTLVLHLAGNLRHFIGAVLGGSGYVRDRGAEFETRHTSRADLSALVSVTAKEVATALGALPASLDDPFPVEVGGHTFTTGAFLLHLAVHLGYHLGQLDYHRRVVSGDATTANAMAVAPLAIGTGSTA